MDNKRDMHVWSLRPSPAGASTWADRAEHWQGRGFFFRRLVPAFFNLGLVTEGGLVISYAGNEVVVRTGELFASWPKVMYNIQTHDGCRATFYRLRLRGVGMRGYFAASGFADGEVRGAPGDPALATGILENIFRMYAAPSRRDPFAALSLLYKFAGACAPRGRVGISGNDSSRELVEQALSIMEGSMEEDLGIADIARFLHVSRATLLRAFHQHVGRTPQAELTRIRIRHARDLLVTTNLKISAIARAAGFANAKYFYRRFRECVGQTPAEHRKEYRQSIP